MTNAARVRQSHRKSRNGCRECKKRHVKCDEKRPTCGGCGVTNRRCSFLDLHPVRLPSPRATASPMATLTPSCSASPASSWHEAITPLPTPATDVGDDVASLRPEHRQRPVPCFDMRHLVLLHHLESDLVATSDLSWFGADGAKLYSGAIFKSAVSAPYLMHELLAFSALHLSTLQSDDADRTEYLEQAADLQGSALALFNAERQNVRNENCMALFVFSSLLGMHTLFDATASSADFTGTLDKITNYLKLHRGVSAVTYQSWHVLRHSEIRHIIDAIEAGDQLHRQQPEDPNNECNKLSSLVHMSSDKLGPGPYKACQEAVDALHWVFGVRRMVPEPYPTHITLAWPIRVSADFVELLEQRQPIPLIILTHWAVLLHVERDFWVFGDAGRRVIRPLLEYLGSYWDEWLDLPKSIFTTG